MARLPWILLATVSLAVTPVACFVVDDNPEGGGAGPGFGGHGTGGSVVSGDACNPVTGDGCPTDGSTCDFNGNTGYFACFPPPNGVAVCGDCDNATAFCSAELTCVVPGGGGDGTCYRYCCTDGDCGTGGTCDVALGKLVLPVANANDAFGLCVLGNAPSCGPASPASGGTCVGGYTGASDGGPPHDGGGTGGGDGGTGGGNAGDGGTGGGGAGDGGVVPDGGSAGHHHDGGDGG
jgi:hypothetical protein